MTRVLLGGPLDGSTIDLQDAAPRRLKLGLTYRIGGRNGMAAVYELRTGSYRFEGWDIEEPAEAAEDHLAWV